MAVFRVGQRVKVVLVSNPECPVQVGDTGTIVRIGNFMGGNRYELSMDIQRHTTKNQNYFSDGDHIVPLDKPKEGSWEKLGFHPRDFLLEEEQPKEKQLVRTEDTSA